MVRMCGSRRLTALRAVLPLVAAACVASPTAASASDIFGTWLRDDGNARVRIAPCGSSICATNIWIRDPARQGEKIGDRLEFRISRAAAKWTGTAYDPQRKLSFSASLAASPDIMTTEGCLFAGLVCRTTRWERIAANPQ